MTSRRQVLPRQVFTPTQGTPPPSHYLLFFEDTNSYQIVARSSLKKINGDVVFIMIRNKLVKTKSAYHGSLEECNSEYLRLTRVSQNESFNDDDGHSITDPITLDLDDSIMQNSMHPRTGPLHSLLSIEPRKRNLTSIASPEKTSDEEQEAFADDETTSFIGGSKRVHKNSFELKSKKKRSTNKSSVTRCANDSNDENAEIDVIENDHIKRQKTQKSSNVLEGIGNRINELNQKLIANSSKFDQQMQKLYSKIDRLSSNVNINTHALEPYIDKSGERFQDKLMFKNINLLGVMATDYGDYSRQILRIIFTGDELKTCILPPGKAHLTREPLDQERFTIFLDAVRFKFKLDSVNFGLFYKSLLRRKLTDFLIEERRREDVQITRQLLKQNTMQRTIASPVPHEFDK
ncbi:unnamed protein product [Rotaria socialis]